MSWLPKMDSAPRNTSTSKDIFDIILVQVSHERDVKEGYEGPKPGGGTRAVLTYGMWNRGMLEVKVAAQAFVRTCGGYDGTIPALHGLLDITMEELGKRKRLECEEERKGVTKDFIDPDWRELLIVKPSVY